MITPEWKPVLLLLLVAAGVGQLVLCVASPAIPVVLGWRAQAAVLPKLLRQVFWTYACYILGAHVAFGLLSVAMPGHLLAGDRLALVVAGFITCWWAVRTVLHFTTFDTGEVAEGPWHRAAEVGLGFLFVALTAVYLLVWIYNLGGAP